MGWKLPQMLLIIAYMLHHQQIYEFQWKFVCLGMIWANTCFTFFSSLVREWNTVEHNFRSIKAERALVQSGKGNRRVWQMRKFVYLFKLNLKDKPREVSRSRKQMQRKNKSKTLSNRENVAVAAAAVFEMVVFYTCSTSFVYKYFSYDFVVKSLICSNV